MKTGNLELERGVALVITLIMLAVVTLMAVVFLAVSRREKESVTTQDAAARAKLMTEAGLARAQSAVTAQILARGNPLAYDLMVSTNFINPFGFFAATFAPDPTIVNYTYSDGKTPLRQADLLAMLVSMKYDIRAPVFVTTNAAGDQDFRFYLDLNRNGRFEPNGTQPVLDVNGRPVVVNGVTLTDNFVGDPEWIAVLEHPEYFYSRTNRIVGRYAYIVLPMGKSLDINFIHNYLKFSTGNSGQLMQRDAYRRNQGVGSWEINLAAFLRELNTNAWNASSYAYNNSVSSPSSGFAFEDAAAVIRYRYGEDTARLKSVNALFGFSGQNNPFLTDWTDGYGLGTISAANPASLNFAVSPLPANDPDAGNTARIWPGVDNPQGFYDLQELFFRTNTKTPLDFNDFRKSRFATIQTNLDSYNRYTDYRMLAQMGTDSASANGKMHLNYDNLEPITGQPTAIQLTVSGGITNFLPWTPLRFFTNAAERILQADLGISLTNIQVYPLVFTNGNPLPFAYNARIHRCLQLAANLFDATTNSGAAYPYFPSVFRPVFRGNGTNIFIAGYTTNATAFADLRTTTWRDPANPADQAAITNANGTAYVYGVPWVIGAKKGFPNFNEFGTETAVQVARKLEIVVDGQGKVLYTNQMYLLGITNRLGVEAWNSYGTSFPRALKLHVLGNFSSALTNELGQVIAVNSLAIGMVTNIVANGWRSNQFIIPLDTNRIVLPDSVYVPNRTPPFVAATNTISFSRTLGFPVPQWGLLATNRFVFALTDPAAGDQVVDLVTLGPLTQSQNISQLVIGNTQSSEPSAIGQMWLTNRFNSSKDINVPPMGIVNQIEVAKGNITLSDSQWASYSHDPIAGADKAKAIDFFRRLLGLGVGGTAVANNRNTAYQVPFSPTRLVYLHTSWQANDPLVHYASDDLFPSNHVEMVVPGNLPKEFNVGKMNDRYSPWGGGGKTAQPRDTDYQYKDPLIYNSDAWTFPTNKYATVGWIGMVHRGTPWQTIYLKAAPSLTPGDWGKWSGRTDTHPTNDWKLVDLFTTAANDNAARGLLSVNQTNQAAWSAVLSGITVLSNLPPSASRVISRFSAASNVLVQVEPTSINTPQVQAIVQNINATRAQVWNTPGGQYFPSLGSVLSSPALTVASPYLNLNPGSVPITDQAYERIPMQILSLLKADEPRVVIYVFGQSLRPAENSIYTGVGPYFGLVTNYTVVGESAARAVLRFDRLPSAPGPNSPLRMKPVIERYNVLPAE